MVDIGELIVGLLGKSKHLLTVLVGQKFATCIEQFQRIPLLGVVRSSDDDTSVSLMRCYSHLDTWCGTEIDIDHVCTTTDQRTFNQAHYHLTRNSGIATHHDLNALFTTALLNETSVSYCILNDVNRRKIFALNATNRTTNTRDRFN